MSEVVTPALPLPSPGRGGVLLLAVETGPCPNIQDITLTKVYYIGNR